jgi:hypothetical protein
MVGLILASTLLGAAVTAYVGRTLPPWWAWLLWALVVSWPIMLPIAVLERTGASDGWSGRTWTAVSVGWGVLLAGLIVVGWEAAGY